jgi:hypothetical protein
MFRKSKLVLVALIAAAPFALAASASAKPLIDPGFNKPIDPGFGNGPKYKPMPYPHPYPKPWPKPQWHPQYRPVIVVEQPVVRQIVSQPVVNTVTRVVSQPAPRTTNCLTKEYSPDGIVTFKDLCTKETASAVLPGSPAALQQQQQLQQQGIAPQGVAPVTQNQTQNTTTAPQVNAQAQTIAQPVVKN